MIHAALMIIFASITPLCSAQHFSQTSDVRALSELPLDRLLQVRNSLLPAPDLQVDFQEEKVVGRRLDHQSPGIEDRNPSTDEEAAEPSDQAEDHPTVHPDANTEEDVPSTSSLNATKREEKKNPNIDVASPKISGAQALPLHAKTNPLNRGGHGGYGYDDDHHSDKKGGKIQSIFQISVTTLAFLAFGGYLLCLLVQAVKGKQTDVTTLAPMVAAFYRPRPQRPPNNRRRTTRRPPRSGPNRRPSYRNGKGGAKAGKRRGAKGGREEGIRRNRREAEGPPLEALDLDRMYDSLISLSEAYAKYHVVDYKFYNRTGKVYN